MTPIITVVNPVDDAVAQPPVVEHADGDDAAPVGGDTAAQPPVDAGDQNVSVTARVANGLFNALAVWNAHMIRH